MLCGVKMDSVKVIRSAKQGLPKVCPILPVSGTVTTALFEETL